MNLYLQGSCGTGQLVNISIIAGETIGLAVQLQVNGVPINLTGYSLKMQVNFPTPILFDTDNGGITITDAVNGLAVVSLGDNSSAMLAIGGFAYDFWMISGGNVATPLFGGAFNVKQSVTPIP